MKNKHLLISLIFIFPSLSFAFFCPTNFTQIDYGYSLEQVLQQCGNPDKQETKEVKNEGPQEWTYYVPQTVSSNTSYQLQGTLKTSVAFDAQGKVINISVNGIGVGATTICGINIQLGDTNDSVKKACGEPSFINTQGNPNVASLPSSKITTFYYNSNPPVTLIFENGKLKEKQ